LIKILIADDHPIVRAGVKQILAETGDMEVIAEASSGQEVINKISSSNCDLILLDISMPGIGGLEALKQLRTIEPKLPILILSQHKEEEYAIRAIKAGASGYVRKINSPDELIAAIRKVTQGRKYITPALAEELATVMLYESEKPPHQLLSDREFQVMCLIARGSRTKEIADELSLSPSTIATYRTRILDKMNLKTDIELTHYVIKNQLFE
jgi:two-component system, NarL family, invasion response regulator UvrY